MTTEKKRKRGVNFTPRECDLLFSIVSKYKHIIENKETNAQKILEKNETWTKVCTEFNAQSVDFVPRSIDQLKKSYDNKKREVKKRKADERMEALKTGGGPPPPRNNEDDLILAIMDPLIVEGDHNEFDSDRVKTIGNSPKFSNPIEFQFCDDNEEDETMVIESTEEQDQQGDLQLNSEDVQEKNITAENFQNTWKKYVPHDLKTPLNPALIRPTINSDRRGGRTDLAARSTEITEENGGRIDEHGDGSSSETPCRVQRGYGKTEFSSGKGRGRFVVADRRRPSATVVRSLAFSALAEKYSELADKKTVIADHAIQKIVSDKLYAEKEHTLRCRSIELDILIKKKQLEKLSKI